MPIDKSIKITDSMVDATYHALWNNGFLQHLVLYTMPACPDRFNYSIRDVLTEALKAMESGDGKNPLTHVEGH